MVAVATEVVAEATVVAAVDMAAEVVAAATEVAVALAKEDNKEEILVRDSTILTLPSNNSSRLKRISTWSIRKSLNEVMTKPMLGELPSKLSLRVMTSRNQS